MRRTSPFVAADGISRLDRLRARRLGENDLSVCFERAVILRAAQERHGQLPRVPRQAAILRDLCEQITPVIEPDDVIAGRMPEVVPSPEQEALVRSRPELFHEPGLPGVLDSISIYVPEWEWLLERGLGGIAAYARAQSTAPAVTDEECVFLGAVVAAMEAVCGLLKRYAALARRLARKETCRARRGELTAMARRCERVAWAAPADFVDALQLLQIVHMVLSCLVGGRDITPGRVDQYLLPFYRVAVDSGVLTRADATVLLATYFLRLSQMAGGGTDFDDNVRRTPCKYSHLYATVGGADADGRSCVNELSFVVADAIRLLRYKEPTLLVRWHPALDRTFAAAVAGLVRDRLPVTVYSDSVVVPALVRHGVPREMACRYAHSACHNSLVPGHEAGSGPGAFHNLPRLVLLAMNGGRDPVSGQQVGAATPGPDQIDSFEALWPALEEQVRFDLMATRRSLEKRWRNELADACPLLASALMKECLDRRRPAWQAATVSHLNHHLMGLATTVDSVTAVRQIVFEEQSLTMNEFLDVLRHDWDGQAALRQRIRRRLPRYGQDAPEVQRVTARLARMWVDAVETVARGMDRLAMWPGFYSHMVHVHSGRNTMATPDGRCRGDALSENQSPSYGSPVRSPLAVLRTMASLPLEHTTSGAFMLSLPGSDWSGPEGVDRLQVLLEAYFGMGGLHLHVNTTDVATLRAALKAPDQHRDLMVRVAGFSAYFTQLTPEVQLDVVQRYENAPQG